MLRTFLAIAFTLMLSWPVSPAPAGDYSITTVGRPAETAVRAFESRLGAQDTGVTLNYIPGLASPNGLLTVLEDGIVDIAVVPFEFVPELSRSPLIEPFLAKDAAEMRRAINSDVGAFEKADVERRGFRVLDFWHVSSTIFGSKTPVTEVDDLRGLKVFDGGGRRDETLMALGASPTPMVMSEVFTALQAGAIDSSAVPLDERAQALGFAEVVSNYVDRLYKPRLYAVLIAEQRWNELPFPDQYHLARAAEETGEDLAETLNLQAATFRSEQLARGSVFREWQTQDIAQVRTASLSTVADTTGVERELINLAFESTTAPRAPADPSNEPRPATEVTLLYATDRKLVDLNRPEVAFSSRRELSGHSFGTAKVSLKAGRTYGDDLEKVSEIENLSGLTRDAFMMRITGTQDRNVVIFVHGYNNAFSDVIRRGATIQTDIAPDALVISYTWPSDGELLSYGYDESSTDTAEQNFKLFMDMLTDAIPAARISIVAHSMGSRLVAKYVAGLPERAILPNAVKFRNLVFAAPDISTEFFEQKEEHPFDPRYPLSVYADRITVYSSRHDRPLGLSRKLHRDQRLGLADENSIYLEPDISAVDASLIDPARWYQKFSFATRHSYVFDKTAGVRELSLLLRGSAPGDRPGMTVRTRDGLSYWVLTP